MQVPTEVVASDIPLLLSKNTLKAAGANIDFKNDTLSLYGIEQPLVNTSTGHYAISISYFSEEERNNQLADIILLSVGEKKTQKELKQIARKLHIQFNHAAGYRLLKLLKDSGNDDPELLNEIRNIESNCEICQRYKKTPARPVVTFPLAERFNECIQLDLKTYIKDRIYFLHIIDHKTRFSAACVIYSKESEVIISAFFKIWISIFGRPEKLLVDNGGEFVNKDFIDLCENFNINIKTTAAESAWSNGLCEKYNGVIGEGTEKVVEDVGCSVEIALAWSVNAKNSLHNVHGFSPYQMVFGQNPNLPLSLNSKPPALEGISSSELVRNHLNALHKARQAFIKSESSDKVRRAMKARVRTHNDHKYYQGDRVYYKRDKEERWRGPATVVIQEGSKVLLKTIGRSLISVHTCRLQHVTHDDESNQVLEEGQHQSTTKTVIQGNNVVSDDDEEQCLPNNPNAEENQALNTSSEENNRGDNHDHTAENAQQELNTSADESEEDTVSSDESKSDTSEAPIQYKNNMLHQPKDLPKANQHVEFRLNNSDTWNHAKIISRAGKASGPYKFWLNFKNLEDNTEASIDWKENVAEWKLLEHNVLMASNVNIGFEDAKVTELNNWKDLKVYNEVNDNYQPAISVRWVLTKKIKNGEEVKKARLVARGYEENGNNIRKESPTCYKESLRIAIMIIASLDWQIHSMDIKSAFLQGNKLEREIYLKPPKEANVKGKLWRLNRCVYGLVDASRYWYLRVHAELIKNRCKASKLDPSVFYYFTTKLEGLLLCHVDDFCYAGSEKFEAVIDDIKSTFKISSEDSTAFKYLGVEIQQCRKGIYVSQSIYTDELEESNINSVRKKNKALPVNDEERSTLRSAIGQLNWLSTQTRPDISFDVCEQSNSFKTATINTLMKTNKIIRKVKQNKTSLFFPKMNLNSLKVQCYTDASHGNLPDGGSQGGMYIEVVSDDKKASIFWQSKRIQRVVKSSMAAETLALVEGIESALLIKSLLNEMLYQNKKTIPIEAITDSKSVFQSAHSTNQILDKGQRINMSMLREYIAMKEVSLKWVSTDHQLANVLTKSGCDSSEILKRVSSAKV